MEELELCLTTQCHQISQCQSLLTPKEVRHVLTENHVVPEIVNQIDIGKLLLNEKMEKPFQKDQSPLVSARRQLSNANSEEINPQGNDSGLLHQQSFDSIKIEDTNRSPIALRFQNQLKKAEKIQEESDETDEDSPWKKKKERQDNLENHLMIENQGTPMSQFNKSSLRSSLKKNSGLALETRKKEFYQLNPTLQKEQRST